MVTRNDVALRAGVSTAVVSYVVNGGPRGVAPHTAERVRAAMAELGYRPNGVARALATNRTYALAFVVPDQANSFFAALGAHIERAAFDRGYTLLLGNTMEEPEREVRYLEVFRQRGVDGFVIAPTVTPSPAVAALTAGRDRVVLVDRDGHRDDISRVLVDNAEGGRLATQHLLDHGHRRIACIAGPDVVSTARWRHTGWEQAMRTAGEDVHGLTVRTDFSREQAYLAMLELLRGDDRPTAVFATADEQAVGIYRAARETGLRIPDDLAVVSFDSADLAPYLTPALTAVSQPLQLMAETAVRRLLEQLDSADTTFDLLPVELVARGSCGCDQRVS